MIIAGTFIYFLSTPPQNYLYPVLLCLSNPPSWEPAYIHCTRPLEGESYASWPS
jgi:hypothetical protein